MSISKEQYIRNQQIIQNRMIKMYVPKVESAIRYQIDHTIHIIRTRGIQAAQHNFDAPVMNEQIGQIVKDLYATAASIAIRKYKPNIKAAFGFNDDFVQAVIDYLKSFLLEKVIRPISQTTIDFIESVLQMAITNGWGVDQTVKELENSDLLKTRARVIVRTETVKATNYAQLAAADSEEWEMEKQWISVDDLRTRLSHSNHGGVDGERIGLYETFSNGLMFPGDPEAPAKEVINCFPGDQLTFVNPKRIKRVFRNIYKGKVVTIQTGRGNNFTCTVNHPILTTKGWVAAGKLTKSDYLIQSESIDRFLTNPDIDNVPTTLEELYNSFIKSGNRVRVANSIVNFYGDIPAGDVDIASAKGLLSKRDKTARIKSVYDNILTYANFATCYLFLLCTLNVVSLKKLFWHGANGFVSLLNKFLLILKGGLFHAQIHGLASISTINIETTQSLTYYVSGNFEMSRKSLYAISGIIKSFYFTGINFRSGRMIGYIKSLINNYVPYFIIVSADNVSDFLNTHPRFSEVNNVADIIFHDYDGYVYTLETDNQMYNINFNLARNCRCTMGYFAARDLNNNLIPKRDKSMNLQMALSTNRAA